MSAETTFLHRWSQTLLSWIGLGNEETKARAHAENWLESADKVWAFRRDVLTERDAAELRQRTDELRQRLKDRAGAAQLQKSIAALEPVLKRMGGAVYPKSALVENVEFFLVAAIVIIGVRTYFLQPFKIPTNSMWPTYYGMTPEVYHATPEEPGPLAVAARAVIYGAWPHRLKAPADGEILLPLSESGTIFRYRTVPGRSWLVFPTQLKEYTLLVGDQPVKVRVPLDFDFEWVINDAFFPTSELFSAPDLRRRMQALLNSSQFEDRMVDGELVRCVRTGRHVRTGDRVLAFDEITGDQLFVDRVSYHFFRPRVGQGFVFNTANIHSENMLDLSGKQIEQYYIKRLVGVPGDEIQIREPMIYRNGQPITGAEAFDLNARRVGKYRGYFYGPTGLWHSAQYLTSAQDKLTVPSNSFFAMGDNSGNSGDSRYWGFVPAKEVVGRPLFIYFPFSKRWGPSR